MSLLLSESKSMSMLLEKDSFDDLEKKQFIREVDNSFCCAVFFVSEES